MGKEAKNMITRSGKKANRALQKFFYVLFGFFEVV